MSARLIKILCWGVGLLTAVALAVFSWPYFVKLDTRRRAESHLVQFTRQDIKNVSLGLLLLCELEKKWCGEVRDGETVLTGREIYELMSRSQDALNATHPNDYSLGHKAFCDRWGNEIRGKVSTHAEGLHVTLWSIGPNNFDEGGKGDDIIEEFDLMVQQKQ